MIRRRAAVLLSPLVVVLAAPVAWAEPITVMSFARLVGAGAGIPGQGYQEDNDRDKNPVTATASVSSGANTAMGTAGLLSSLSADGRLLTATSGVRAQTFAATRQANAHASAGVSMLFTVTSPQAFDFSGTFAGSGPIWSESPYEYGYWRAQLAPLDGNSIDFHHSLFSYEEYGSRSLGTTGTLVPGDYSFNVFTQSVASARAGGALGASGYDFQFRQADAQTSVTPEPASLSLLCLGMLGVGVRARRRRGGAGA